jgi:hypothetical protein
VDKDSVKIPLSLDELRMIGLQAAVGATVRLEKMISTRLVKTNPVVEFMQTLIEQGTNIL